MTIKPADAERLLLARYDGPAKSASDYVIGFRNPVGRVLAIHRTIQDTPHLVQPPAPPPPRWSRAAARAEQRQLQHQRPACSAATPRHSAGRD